MNEDIINEMKEEIKYLFAEEDGYLTDDLLQRYDDKEDYDYNLGNKEEFMAVWLADLLSFEIIMEELGMDFDFDSAYNNGLNYLEGFEKDNYWEEFRS